MFDADVTPGTYHQVKFKIHKVEDADAAANPQLAPMAGKSVEITGTGANGSFTLSWAAGFPVPRPYRKGSQPVIS